MAISTARFRLSAFCNQQESAMSLRERINEIINHPSARPTVEQGDHELDCGDVLDRPGVVAFADGGKALLFEPLPCGVYLAHVFCIAGERGKRALAYGAECCDRMFREYGAKALQARAPRILPQVSIYAHRLGFRRIGSTAQENIYWKAA
jgi:hypothetical protein